MDRAFGMIKEEVDDGEETIMTTYYVGRGKRSFTKRRGKKNIYHYNFILLRSNTM